MKKTRQANLELLRLLAMVFVVTAHLMNHGNLIGAAKRGTASYYLVWTLFGVSFTCIKNQDSSGGVIECCVTGLPAGIGDPVFDKLDARLASAIMSIGAVKAVEIGDGIEVSSRKGSENNDAFCIKDGQVSKKTNHAGGILGGISDGSPVLLRAHIKPTPSIFQPQQTIGRDHMERTLQIKGRHDPVIVPRAVVVVESMTALTILDLMLSNMGARMDHLEKIYTK